MFGAAFHFQDLKILDEQRPAGLEFKPIKLFPARHAAAGFAAANRPLNHFHAARSPTSRVPARS